VNPLIHRLLFPLDLVSVPSMHHFLEIVTAGAFAPSSTKRDTCSHRSMGIALGRVRIV
jgi:hypothetical protein